MQPLLHRGRRKNAPSISLVHCVLCLSLGVFTAAAVPDVTRRTMSDIYNSGRMWFSSREMGVHRCTVHGVLATKVLNLGGDVEYSPSPVDVTYAMDLWYRLKTNETHTIV